MRHPAATLLLLVSFCCRLEVPVDAAEESASAAAAPTEMIVVRGAGGEAQYHAAFQAWESKWHELADAMQAQLHVISGEKEGKSAREQFQSTLATLKGKSDQPVWIVLIGHGTYFDDIAKFNLEGPDFSARDLSEWLAPIQRPLAIINCASASGPFVDRLSGENRVIITATQNGMEQNYARFGQYFAEAAQSPHADLDHDGTLSLLEAFLRGARDTQTYYDEEARLATEHALLDDNGDRSGTSADFFRGIRAVARSEGGKEVDGLRAHQWTLMRFTEEPELTDQARAERDSVEEAIEALRALRNAMPENQYYDQMEDLMVRMARIYEGNDPAPELTE